jgi:hypothetical protein
LFSRGTFQGVRAPREPNPLETGLTKHSIRHAALMTSLLDLKIFDDEFCEEFQMPGAWGWISDADA